MSEFIGRHEELRTLVELEHSGNARLITVTGPAGIGKTRLVGEVARRNLDEPDTAVHWARLNRLPPNATTGAIAEEVVRWVATIDTTGRSAWDVLMDTLTTREPRVRTVLALDNCEHLLPATATLVTNLLESLPSLVILATSREPFGWSDEYIFTIPPLPIDSAIGLFKRHARLTRRPIPDDPHHLEVAREICRRVDNNPLFIRLAAARLSHLPIETVLRELSGKPDDQRMQWHPQDLADVDDHHRAVRDAIAWSYDICTPAEQLLLERFSVFASGFESTDADARGGGAELRDIQAVCAGPDLSPEDITWLLERLVERSLVSTHFTATTVRYYLLHSVRAFAAQRLVGRDPTAPAPLLARHRRHYRDVVISREAGWFSAGEPAWLAWARGAWEDLLQAIDTSFDHPAEAVVGLEIAILLMGTRAPFVLAANRIITRLAEQALDTTRTASVVPTNLRIAATALIGWNALWQGRPDYTSILLDECAHACLPDDDVREHWRSTALIDIGLPAPVEFTWGFDMLMQLDPAAIDVLTRAHNKFEQIGDKAGVKRSKLFLVLAGGLFHQPAQALYTAYQYLKNAQISGAAEEVSGAELTWLITLTTHGDPNAAERAGRDLVKKHQVGGDRWVSGMVVQYVMAARARVLATMVDAQPAHPAQHLAAVAIEVATLQGGLSTLHRSMGFGFRDTPLIARETDNAINVATKVLGREAYASMARRGALLRPEADELQRFVLGDFSLDDVAPGSIGPARALSRWRDLTPAESEVATLAAAGWQNAAIAERRGSSIRTVDAQVAAIRQKLMITTRSDIIWHLPPDLEDRVHRETQQWRNQAMARKT
ncbi:ATP-binding protein [Nocardia sp. NPDC057668]|uniref:ATP-binding protein n=1 Tax=Nocardia sp. NPDC057668 TaxID=3346202 RepID=UPI00366EDDFD